MACAEVLLSFGADINALNHAGETPFHVAALNRQIEFGSYLIEKKANKSCNSVKQTQRGAKLSCTKCRYLTKMIQRMQQKKSEDSRQEQAKREAEEKAAAQEAEKKREKRRQRRLR